MIKAGDTLIPVLYVRTVDLSRLEAEGVVEITTDEKTHILDGTEAIEAVMVLKPSALEGRRLKWRKGAWAVHNLIGHPGMQILAWLGLYKSAIALHDRTVPRPR